MCLTNYLLHGWVFVLHLCLRLCCVTIVLSWFLCAIGYRKDQIKGIIVVCYWFHNGKLLFTWFVNILLCYFYNFSYKKSHFLHVYIFSECSKSKFVIYWFDFGLINCARTVLVCSKSILSCFLVSQPIGMHFDVYCKRINTIIVHILSIFRTLN